MIGRATDDKHHRRVLVIIASREMQRGCTWNPGERIIAVERVRPRACIVFLTGYWTGTYVCNVDSGSRCIGFNTPREHNLTIGLSTDKISPTELTRTLVIRPFKGTKVSANYKIANTYAIRLKRGSCLAERFALPCTRVPRTWRFPRLFLD